MKEPAILALSLLVLLGGCSAPAGPHAAEADPLVGAWQSQVAFKDGPLAQVHDLEFLYAFNAGGTLTESSNYDGAPPVPPAYGAWRRTAPGRYEARYLFFNTQPPADWKAVASGGGWNPAGRGELRETIEIAADGRSYTSTLSLALYDLAGKPVEGGGMATGHAIRIGF
jgi:hypothetical protein